MTILSLSVRFSSYGFGLFRKTSGIVLLKPLFYGVLQETKGLAVRVQGHLNPDGEDRVVRTVPEILAFDNRNTIFVRKATQNVIDFRIVIMKLIHKTEPTRQKKIKNDEL